MKRTSSDAIIIGGGFYGCSLAIYLRKYFKTITILEKEPDIMARASYTNQARVHNGYHYPRSYLTAARSHANYKRFLKEFSTCVDSTFTNIYAVGKHNSYITASRFQDFCKDIKLPIKQTPSILKNIFNTETIEDSFIAEEAVFNATRIRKELKKKIAASNISILLDTQAKKVTAVQDMLQIYLENGKTLQSTYVFNCTYGHTNTILKQSNLPLLPIKYELTEIALIRVPSLLKNIGITVIDGPFFSFLPFPDKNLHTLSHVSYTPHAHNRYTSTKLYKMLQEKKNTSQYMYMLKDAQRFVPSLSEATYLTSLYDVKTILLTNENDDGRPILFRKDYGFKNFYVVMGGKIDNIYDVYEALDKELS